ncbi:CGCGG family rSAM-modified RiPP protein [Alicyclobacillus cycloheptanicus]|uniref:CGCGG family rSAM target protein n=1 Tax=Alicyclobacillus cycloheptanicus TaxID=1457 RepID=A0ABT9XLF8_9BACL|nr:CGCGG family rSAM-modified RiPP protein [Alicyclobacillus cycloheptanicus]MDQ0191057.1 putative CGCGG family rSAM target protein [Alicyclobacillus cycloheptanicus]WDM00853.1 CGCGG family rSAM-modified RiPP protein [Alicyclobacillus cycloheptanicus]
MGNWSVNLETEQYVENRELILKDSIEAILDTKPGYFVNLAVSENHGNPDDYLVPALQQHFGDQIQIRFIDQCGCGGYVYRVTRNS